MDANDRFAMFTEQAKKVLELAKIEAGHFQHNYIGTEHLLLGLIGEKEGMAVTILAELGVEQDKIRSTIESIIGHGDRIVLSEISLTPRAKKVIELAVDEAGRLGHHAIGTEHLLLGMVREGEGIAAGVLESLGVNLEKVHRQILQMLGQSDAPQELDQRDRSHASSQSELPQKLDLPDARQGEHNTHKYGQFTEQAKKVLAVAEVEAQRLQHNYIGTEHLLLGLVSDGESATAKLLIPFGVELNKVRSAVEFIIGRGDRVVLGKIGLTPRVKKVIELAADEAVRLNHHAIGTEHLLLGVVREGEGIAVGVLESLGVNLEKVRRQTMQMLDQSSGPRAENSTQVSDQSDILPEEDPLQVLSQSGISYEEFDSDTENSLASLDNEGEDSSIYGWSQEASDNLGKVAADAAKTAQQHPGLWVNPLKPYLLSRIRYAQTPDQIRQFLLETSLGREIIKEHLDQYSGGFFQIYSPKMNGLFVRIPENEAISVLKDSWYEEIYRIQDEHYSKVIRLIKRMGGLETDKIRTIQSRRCFTGRSTLPGYDRFISADRRFPVSVCYPRQLSFFYDFNDERNLHVDWDGQEGSLWISRENFGMSAQSGNRNAKLVLQGKKNISQFMLEDFAQGEARALMAGVRQYPRKPQLEDKLIGEREQSLEAKRLVWLSPSGQYGGEWVFFMRARLAGTWSPYTTTFNPRALLPELWTIANSLLDEEDFNVFLSSFHFLSLDFFRSLPAQY